MWKIIINREKKREKGKDEERKVNHKIDISSSRSIATYRNLHQQPNEPNKKESIEHNTQIGSDGSSHEYQFAGYWLADLVGEKNLDKIGYISTKKKQKNTRRK